MKYEQAKHLKPAEFKRFWGVKLETFEQMVEIVSQKEGQKKKSGRPGKASLEDQVLMTLEYWREYRTYFHIGQTWGVTVSTACRIIRKIEKILSQSRVFTLPGKKCLQESNTSIDAIVIDVTESPIERPKKTQKRFFSGKKKRHTLKSQVIVNQKTGEIICTAHSQGKTHDFTLFKQSKISLNQTIKCLVDKGYQGIQKLHANSQVPKKKPRKGELTDLEKKRNRELARKRVVGEHINRRLKIFKILADRYRNRRKRFGLRFNLIAGLYNYELRLSSANEISKVYE